MSERGLQSFLWFSVRINAFPKYTWEDHCLCASLMAARRVCGRIHSIFPCSRSVSVRIGKWKGKQHVKTDILILFFEHLSSSDHKQEKETNSKAVRGKQSFNSKALILHVIGAPIFEHFWISFQVYLLVPTGVASSTQVETVSLKVVKPYNSAPVT